MRAGVGGNADNRRRLSPGTGQRRKTEPMVTNSGACSISRQGSRYQLVSRACVPASINSVFEFFSDAGNLDLLTPPFLQFQILTPRPIAMGVGTLIDYRLRLRGIRLRWQSEITAWDPPYRFVDEQRRGPYRVWIHEHCFEEAGGETEIIDRVEYAVPGGRWLHRLFVRRDLVAIFDYRRRRLIEYFSGREGPRRVCGNGPSERNEGMAEPLFGAVK